jgi:hypothetical protein
VRDVAVSRDGYLAARPARASRGSRPEGGFEKTVALLGPHLREVDLRPRAEVMTLLSSLEDITVVLVTHEHGSPRRHEAGRKPPAELPLRCAANSTALLTRR